MTSNNLPTSYTAPATRFTTDNCTFDELCALAAYQAQVAHQLCEQHSANLALTFEGVSVSLHVSVNPAGHLVGSIWDQIIINGKPSENRHAGRDRVMALYAPVILRAALAFDAKARELAA